MEISVSKTRITPEGKFFPCYLLGHAIRTEKATGVADDLWANAMVLKIENESLVWITIDLALFPREATEAIRTQIHDKYGVKKECINLGFIHTHAAPEYDIHSPFSKERGAIPGYLEFVQQQILEAVDACFAQDFIEVNAFYKTTMIDGFYGNRNGLDKVADKAITTIEFHHENHVVAGIINFTCHPTVLGPQNLLVSADLAGYLARQLQHQWGVYPLVMQGAAGDMSNRLYRQGNDYHELKRTGEGIMQQINANQDLKPLQLAGLKVKTHAYHREYQLDVEKKKRNIEKIKEKIQNAKNFDEKKVYSSALAVAENTVNQTEYILDLQCTLYKAKDLFVVCIPAELFSCFGLQLKAKMGVNCPIIWGYSNYSVGYLVDRAEYGNSFESAVSEIPEGTTEEIIAELLESIRGFDD